MTLIEPTFIDKHIRPNKRVILYAIAGIALLGAVLFLFDRCGTFRDNRIVDQHKGNIANGLAKVEEIENNIANLKVAKEIEMNAVNAETQVLLQAVKTTNEVKVVTNQHVANWMESKNVNTANATGADLSKALEGLE